MHAIMAPAPIGSSPLKVTTTEGGTLLLAESPDGRILVEGRRGAAAEPSAAIMETAGGTWRFEHREPGETQEHVYDDYGDVVASITRRHMRPGEIELADGERIGVSSGRGRFSHGCAFGELALASAPMLRPDRFFTLKLSNALLARDDCELIVAIAAHVGESEIASSIEQSRPG